MGEARVDGVHAQMEELPPPPHKNRASSSVLSAGMTESMSREHANGLVERSSSSHLFAFLCIYDISEVRGGVIWRDAARALNEERGR